jgi:hypothetical protein
LTGDSGGEKLGRHHFTEGQVVLGDRVYATARGLYAVRQQGAHAVVRFNPVTLRTCDERRRRIYLAEKEPEIPKVGVVEFNMIIPVPPPPTRSHKTWDLAKAIAWIPARAIAARTRTGEVIWVVTTLPVQQMPAIGILGLYRVRWQIELLFKRLKSLLHLDSLPSREGPTAKSWILSPLSRPHWRRNWCNPRAHFPPGATNCGQPNPPAAPNNPRTHSAWSRFRMTLWALRVAILGRGPWLVIRDEQHLERLCNSPRKRHLASHELNHQLSLFC